MNTNSSSNDRKGRKGVVEQRRASLKRRRFLQQVFGGVGVAAAGLASRHAFGAERQSEQPYASTAPQPQGKPPQFKTKLKITKLESFLVKPRWLFLKIHTDAGIIGLGEPILEGRARTCAAFSITPAARAFWLAYRSGTGMPSSRTACSSR